MGNKSKKLVEDFKNTISTFEDAILEKDREIKMLRKRIKRKDEEARIFRAPDKTLLLQIRKQNRNLDYTGDVMIFAIGTGEIVDHVEQIIQDSEMDNEYDENGERYWVRKPDL
jgi:hypothetical protein